MNDLSITQAENEIARNADWLGGALRESRARADAAGAAGAALAADVYAYLEDPDGVGTDRLRMAYETFMGLHAGNFTPVAVSR